MSRTFWTLVAITVVVLAAWWAANPPDPQPIEFRCDPGSVYTTKECR